MYRQLYNAYRKKYRTDGVAIGGQWTKGTGTPGSADISATIKGRSVKIEVKYGNYWMARQSGTGTMVDLTKYNEDMITYFVENFDKARKAGVFLPNTNNCNRCGLTEHCPFTSKKENK